MKNKYIKTFESFNEVNSNEAINLKLTKELSKDWDKTQLDNIFGKNIYRLYYDLESGKQITPTKKDPKLKFDVKQNEKLKKDINNILNTYGYEVLDFNNNEAVNKKTNQKIKISKILEKLDLEFFKRYALFLDSFKRSVSSNKKLYAMVSRHPHDISTMGSYDKTSSCADISDFKTKKQIENERDSEGYEIILSALENGSVIIYLIEEGDWNKQRPIARYLLGKLCGYTQSPPTYIYGDFNQTFANFIESWVDSYNINVLNKQPIDYNNETFFNQDSKTLINILEKNKPEYSAPIYSTHFNNKEVDNNYSTLLRGLIKYNRYDVLYNYINLIGTDMFLSFSNNTYGDEIYKKFPNNIKNLFKKSYNELYNHLIELYNGYNGNIEKTGIIKIFMNSGMDKEEAIYNFLIVIKLHDKLQEFNGMARFNKIFNNEEYNKINALKSKVDNILKEYYSNILF